MWLSKREIARLERELSAALQRAKAAEDALAAERQAKDWLVLQLASRVITKHGGYGLDHEPSPPKVVEPQRFVRQPTEIDLAKLEYYKQCAAAAGKPEEDAVQKWEAEMRGESIAYEYESEQ
jgi:hypothetical protein